MDAGQVMRFTAQSCKVFLVLIDSHYYVRSEYCMRELRAALVRKDCLVAPVFLSRMDTYPISVEASYKVLDDELFTSRFRGWERKDFAGTVQDVLQRTGLRACEDKTFELAHVVVSVEELLVSGTGFSPTDLVKNPELCERVEKIKAATAHQGTASVYRRAHPILRCKVPRVDEKSVDLHETSYDSVKRILITKNKSASIVGVPVRAPVGAKAAVGVRGAGGVGKTWLAIRLGNDTDVLAHFSDGVLFATFGAEENTSTEALRRLWSDLGGRDVEMEILDLSNARSFFTQLLCEREPKTLLILDDIWNERYLEVFKDVTKDHPTIKLLVTSRQQKCIEVAFGESCTIHPIQARLTKNEALCLMRSFTQNHRLADDEEAMLRVAAQVDSHPKALSIVSTQARLSKTWRDYADVLEESLTEVPEADAVVKEVKKAIWFTFKNAFEDSVIAEERFLRLGGFVEDAYFTEADVRHVWQNANAAKTFRWLRMFIECSIVERARSGDGLLYLHDLVRQCAREESDDLTRKYDAEFTALMRQLVRSNKADVTQYMFDWLEKKHDDECYEAQALRHAYAQSKKGKFEGSWNKNPIIVMRAVQFDSRSLSGASIELCRSANFFERVLGVLERFT